MSRTVDTLAAGASGEVRRRGATPSPPHAVGPRDRTARIVDRLQYALPVQSVPSRLAYLALPL